VRAAGRDAIKREPPDPAIDEQKRAGFAKAQRLMGGEILDAIQLLEEASAPGSDGEPRAR